MGLGDMRNLRRDLANQAWSVEILLTVSDESDKINTQGWSWNITVDTVRLLSLMRQVFIFILKCIVYAAFCGLIWQLQQSRSWKLVDDTAWTTQIWRVCFVRKDEMSYYRWNEWKQSIYVTVLAFATIEDLNICLPMSGGKKVSSSKQPSNCIVSDRLKALFKLLLILLFYLKP